MKFVLPSAAEVTRAKVVQSAGWRSLCAKLDISEMIRVGVIDFENLSADEHGAIRKWAADNGDLASAPDTIRRYFSQYGLCSPP